MLKVVAVFFAVMACCYCLDAEVASAGDARAKKKKSPFRLWALLLLIVVSKVAVFKIASIVMLTAFFQKLFYLGGLLLNYMIKSSSQTRQPSTSYGPPEYNTVGYSYGPPGVHGGPNPEVESFHGPQLGLPSLTDIGGTFNNWLFNKN